MFFSRLLLDVGGRQSPFNERVQVAWLFVGAVEWWAERNGARRVVHKERCSRNGGVHLLLFEMKEIPWPRMGEPTFRRGLGCISITFIN